MLVLTRKPGESVVTGGGIKITLAQVKGKPVRVVIDAADDTPILRGELAVWKDEDLGVSLEETLGRAEVA
jgi:carbon storage regulator CsrA